MDRETGPAVLAACAARRWLARNAIAVNRLRSLSDWPAPALTSLVSCLPALEDAELHVPSDMGPNDVNCLLEALAWCPLRALDLQIVDGFHDVSPGQSSCPEEPAFAKLRSLTKLSLSLSDADFYTLADMVYALVPLTGVAELKIYLPATVSHRAIDEELFERAVVPAALGRLKALRSLRLHGSEECVLKPGCLNLPDLLSLELWGWDFENAEVLPGASALQSLTRIEFSGGDGPRFFDRQLV